MCLLKLGKSVVCLPGQRETSVDCHDFRMTNVTSCTRILATRKFSRHFPFGRPRFALKWSFMNHRSRRMSITPQQLEILMQEVEVSDPIDFADLPFNEQELRALIANHLCEMADAMQSFSAEDRNLALLAVAAKLVLENLVLHVQLLRQHGLPMSDSVEALLQRLRGAS